jgi:hypothetical protein
MAYCKEGHRYDENIYGENCPFCPEDTSEEDVEKKEKLYENALFLISQVQGSHCFVCKNSEEKTLLNFGNSHCSGCDENFIEKFENASGTIPRIEVLDNIREKYLYKLRKQGYDLYDVDILNWEMKICEAMIALSATISSTGPAQQYINLYMNIREKFKEAMNK